MSYCNICKQNHEGTGCPRDRDDDRPFATQAMDVIDRLKTALAEKDEREEDLGRNCAKANAERDRLTARIKVLKGALEKIAKSDEPISDFTQFDAADVGSAAMNMAREIAKAALKEAHVKCKGTLANNLCPDHRDKQTGKPCLACEIERKDRQIAFHWKEYAALQKENEKYQLWVNAIQKYETWKNRNEELEAENDALQVDIKKLRSVVDAQSKGFAIDDKNFDRLEARVKETVVG
jgi:hypothetical protein